MSWYNSDTFKKIEEYNMANKLANDISPITEISKKATDQLVRKTDEVIMSALKDFLKVDHINIEDLAGRCER